MTEVVFTRLDRLAHRVGFGHCYHCGHVTVQIHEEFCLKCPELFCTSNPTAEKLWAEKTARMRARAPLLKKLLRVYWGSTVVIWGGLALGFMLGWIH